MKLSVLTSLVLILGIASTASAHQKKSKRRSASSSSASYGSSGLAGHQCSASDTDPTTCKVCAIYGEDRSTRAGMAAVAGVIETRRQNGRWGSSICAIVHQRGQFIGAWHRLPNNPQLLATIESESHAPANGYLGFRSYCKPGRSTRIGENCFGTASIELDGSMTADDVDAQGEQMAIQFADLFDTGEG